MAGEIIGKAVQGLVTPVKTVLDILFNSTAGKTIRAGASALVGIPAAVATTMVLASFYTMSKAAMYSHRHFKNVWNIGDVKVDDPTLVAISDFFWDAIGTTWTEFGIYGYLRSAELFKEHAARMQDDLGFGNSADNADDKLNIYAIQESGDRRKEDSEKKVKNLTKKILQSIPLSEEEKAKQHAEFEKWLKWIHAPNAPKNEDDFSDANANKLNKWFEEAPKSVTELLSVNNELLETLLVLVNQSTAKRADAMKKLIKKSDEIQPRSFPTAPLEHSELKIETKTR